MVTSSELVSVRPLKCPPLQEIPTNTLMKWKFLKKAKQKLVVAMVDEQLAVEIGSPQWDNQTQVSLENDTQKLHEDETQMLWSGSSSQ